MFWGINWIHIEVNRTKMVNFPPPVVAIMKFYVNYAEYSEFLCACPVGIENNSMGVSEDQGTPKNDLIMPLSLNLSR